MYSINIQHRTFTTKTLLQRRTHLRIKITFREYDTPPKRLETASYQAQFTEIFEGLLPLDIGIQAQQRALELSQERHAHVYIWMRTIL